MLQDNPEETGITICNNETYPQHLRDVHGLAGEDEESDEGDSSAS